MESGLSASPMAEEMALMNRFTDATSERMFLGALVYAYSSAVMDARISEMAISTYEPVCAQTLMDTTIALPSASAHELAW